MKKFIKQNLILFIVACTTVFIFLIMLFFIFEANFEKAKADIQLDELKQKIEHLNAYKPYPSEKNIELIKKDIDTLKEKIFQLENIFGNIYAKPLSAFIQQFKQHDIQSLKKKLELLEKENIPNKKIIEETKKQLMALTAENNIAFEIYFLKAWKTYIENKKKAKDQISLNKLLDEFIESQKYDAETFQKAKNIFIFEMKKQTSEPLNNEIINDYILNALGIPLYFSRVKGKTMVFTVQDEINKLLIANNVAIPENQLVLFSEITTIPTDEQIPYIINYCRFLEDLYKRLAKAKIESIESYNKINGLKGKENSNFLIFRYQIKVVTSQESLRNFLNSLQEAYKDNRIYVITSLSVSAMDDSSTNLPPYIPSKNSKQSQQIKILLGTSDMVKASITLDYIIFKKKILN